MAERMMDREEQIEALARRTLLDFGREFDDRHWSYLVAHRQKYELVMIAWLGASRAIELAEATRDAAARECSTSSSAIFNNYDVGYAAGCERCADEISAMPLPIADGGGDG